MRTILLALAFVCAVALAQPAGQGAKVPAGQAARRWTQPKTTWGDPDLEGVWTSDNNFSIPLERPAEVSAALRELTKATQPSAAHAVR